MNGGVRRLEELVGGAETAIRYGLYDREAFDSENWVK